MILFFCDVGVVRGARATWSGPRSSCLVQRDRAFRAGVHPEPSDLVQAGRHDPLRAPLSAVAVVVGGEELWAHDVAATLTAAQVGIDGHSHVTRSRHRYLGNGR